MIIELELLEQIADHPFEWSLARALEFVDAHKESWSVISALYRDRCLTFHDPKGEILPDWKVEEVFRNRNTTQGARVFLRITDAGARRAFESAT